MTTINLLVVLGTLGIFFYGGCQGLELVFKPSSIIEGQTKNLTITCQVPDNRDVTVVTFLQLAKVTERGQVNSLVELLPGVQQPLFVDNGFSLRAQATGQMDASTKGAVFLSVTIPEPLSSDRGRYECTMSYVSSDHHPATDTAEATLAAIDLATIGEDLWSLRDDVEVLKNCSCQSATDREVVAFSSRVFGARGEETLRDGQFVPFSVVEFETHAILNASDRVFTIPRTGIYSLTLTLLAGQSSPAGFRADLQVNYLTKATMLVDKTHSSTMALNLKLVQGQEVTVVAFGGSYFTIDHYSYFSGNLIS